MRIKSKEEENERMIIRKRKGKERGIYRDTEKEVAKGNEKGKR